MKKGFTLIELLAVIVLIGVLSVIGTISVTKLVKSSKEKTYQEQIRNIEISAKTWATNNTSLLSLTSDFQTYVSIEELKQAGLLENKDIVDPRTDKTMTGCVQITYNTETKKYKYKYSNKCGDKADYPTLDIKYNDQNYIEVTQDAQDKKAEIINHMSINAFDKNGNVVDVEGPVITQKGEIVDTIIPNKVGDEYILTYVASQNNLKTTKSLKLKVVDTTPPEIYLSGINVTDRIVDYNIRTNDSFSEPTLIVKDNSGESLKAVKSGQINIQRVGEYKLVYTATDSSKNKSTYTVNVAVRARGQLSFSLAASEVTANNGWYKTDPTVTIKNLKIENVEGTPNIDKTTCKYSINSGSVVSLGTQRSFVVSKEGSSVKVKVDCSYNDGNDTYSDSQTITLRIDKTPPKFDSISNSSDSKWTNKNVEIKVKASDAASGIKQIYYAYSNSPTATKYSDWNMDNTSSVSGTWVAERNAEVFVIVEDKVGNISAFKSAGSVKIDKTPPTCTSSGGNATWTNGSRTLTGTCIDTEGSGCKENVSKLYSKEIDTTTASPGTVYDNAGNSVTCPDNQTVKIDKTDPYSPYVLDQDPRNYNVISSSCTCRPAYLYGTSRAQTCTSDINSLFGLLPGGNHCVVNVKPNSNWQFWIYSKDSGGSGPAYIEYTTGNLGKGTYYRREFGEPISDGSWFSSTIYIRTYDKAGNVSPLMELTTNK